VFPRQVSGDGPGLHSRVRFEVDFHGQPGRQLVQALQVVLKHQARVLLPGDKKRAKAEVDAVLAALDVGREHAAGSGKF
jgi:hypothetical protein